jgi:UDP-N-acetylmuramoylalanine--D-glutamate ligase
MTFVDEAPASAPTLEKANKYQIIRDPLRIEEELLNADVVIKSPGVSLYHPWIQKLLSRGTPVTSLLNLWFAEGPTSKTICITGTKGKSTTASLVAHMLKKLGKSCVLLGNIGTPITSEAVLNVDFVVIEVSSYQAANFEGQCDIGVLTSLYPEHLDWHRSLEAYYNDKLNLLKHAKVKIISRETLETLTSLNIRMPDALCSNRPDTYHSQNGIVYKNNLKLGAILNDYLSRQHNIDNVCTALTVLENLGLDTLSALSTLNDFEPLPHRQCEVGVKGGVLYVDDSISTAPQSTIVAIDVYQKKSITLILGGYDRGIDYSPLISHVMQHNIHALIFLGPSGVRMAKAIKKFRSHNLFMATSMKEAVHYAETIAPKGGVILLSPAAPSYGLFKDFIERGLAFAHEAGFQNTN